mmetsp:Transcript_266/g.338  ORF Transcript_266/g.338 Transcript_266/m.338 type:complete len:142 (-) Transcript_266:707-1132(-)
MVVLWGLENFSSWFDLMFNHEIAKEDYDMVAQNRLNGRTNWALRAKVTGGCMAHNAYVVVRGAKAAFDEWGLKAPGWSYDDSASHWQFVLYNFNFTTDDGSISRPKRNGEYINSLEGLCEEAGYTLNRAFNTVDGPHNGCS